jgi:hypothetical protein
MLFGVGKARYKGVSGEAPERKFIPLPQRGAAGKIGEGD